MKHFHLLLILSLGIFGQFGFASSKVTNSNYNTRTRVIRNADSVVDEQETTAMPSTEDSAILDKIRQGLTRLRHAEDRLKQFVDKIEKGIEPKTGKSISNDHGLQQDQDTLSDGEIVDFHKLIAAYKDVSSQSFPQLIKRISDDTHILLDQLQGRLDAAGHLAKGMVHDPEDKSAEDHHKS